MGMSVIAPQQISSRLQWNTFLFSEYHTSVYLTYILFLLCMLFHQLPTLPAEWADLRLKLVTFLCRQRLADDVNVGWPWVSLRCFCQHSFLSDLHLFALAQPIERSGKGAYLLKSSPCTTTGTTPEAKLVITFPLLPSFYSNPSSSGTSLAVYSPVMVTGVANRSAAASAASTRVRQRRASWFDWIPQEQNYGSAASRSAPSRRLRLHV